MLELSSYGSWRQLEAGRQCRDPGDLSLKMIYFKKPELYSESVFSNDLSVTISLKKFSTTQPVSS